MKGKKFAKFSISLTLVLLLLVGAFQVVIDPLFQYHKLWFGLKADVLNERYQSSGIAKTFDYENIIMGNSMSENFRIYDFEELFGGKTVKLTMSGSHALDWTYLLNVVKNSQNTPKIIQANLDQSIILGDPKKLKHELPVYLYDTLIINDVNYLFNFQIIEGFSVKTVYDNLNNNIIDENDLFVWSEKRKYGKEAVLQHFNRAPVAEKPADDEDGAKLASENMNLLTPYIKSMPDTQFVFFWSPFSMLYWDNAIRSKSIGNEKEALLKSLEILTAYDNVTVYLWTDYEILSIMSDLDNYADEQHYSGEVSKLLLNRMARGEGKLSTSNYEAEVNKLFDYFESFNFDLLYG